MTTSKFHKNLGFLLIAALLFAASGCKVAYSFSGADIPAEASTFSVELFKSSAAQAQPTYAAQLTDKLKQQILSQTRLDLAKSNGDLQYSGTVTSYSVLPAAITGNESAGANRFSITVHVSYVNKFDEKKNFEKDFSTYRDFPAGTQLTAVEASLLSEINSTLVIDIFNASLGNW